MLNKDSWKSALKIGLIFILLAGILYFSYRIIDIFAMFVIALLIVYAIFPVVNLFRNRGLHRKAATILSFTVFAIVIVITGALILPDLYREITNLTKFLNKDLLTSFQDILVRAEQRLGWILPELNFSDLIDQLPAVMQTSAKEITGVVMGFFTGAWNAFFTLLIVLFLLQDLDGIKTNITHLFPKKYQLHVSDGIKLVDEKVGAFLRGNLIRCTLVGIIDGALLAFFGMPFSVTLGIIAGITNIIPYIGPIVGAVTGILVSLSGNTPHPLLVLTIYLVTQAVDNIYLIPYLLGKAVNLRPITVITGLLVGGKLFGFLGMLLAIPVAAVIKALLEVYIMKENIPPAPRTKAIFRKKKNK